MRDSELDLQGKPVLCYDFPTLMFAPFGWRAGEHENVRIF